MKLYTAVGLSVLAWGLLPPVPSTGTDAAVPAAELPPLPAPEGVEPGFMQTLRHHQWVRDWTEARQADEDPNVWVGPGIIAHRDRQRVTFWAEATGLPPDTPVEFLIIDESSGHDYEAIAISYAKPSDIYKALTFIGLPPGEPFMSRSLRFFPKGERVDVSFRWRDEAGEPVEVTAESLVGDRRTGAALPATGFTFVGSQWLKVDGERIFAADQMGPRSILSLYNEPTTVLDRPRRAGQQQVYGFLHAHPDRQPAHGTLLEVVLVPEYPEGRRRVADVVLEVDAPSREAGVTLQLRDQRGEALHEAPSLTGVLAALERLTDAGRTAFVRVQSAPVVPLAELRSLYRWLRTFQDEDILHIEPPQGNELFYRAFLPNEDHRDPAQRPSQALELRIPSDSAAPAQVIDRQDPRRRIDDAFDPRVTVHEVQAADQLPALLENIQHRLPVLLVFAPAQMTLGDLMAWLGPVRDTHPTVHLFLD